MAATSRPSADRNLRCEDELGTTHRGFQKGPDGGPSCPGEQPVGSGLMCVALLGLRAHAKPPASGRRGTPVVPERQWHGTEERAVCVKGKLRNRHYLDVNLSLGQRRWTRMRRKLQRGRDRLQITHLRRTQAGLDPRVLKTW